MYENQIHELAKLIRKARYENKVAQRLPRKATMRNLHTSRKAAKVTTAISDRYINSPR